MVNARCHLVKFLILLSFASSCYGAGSAPELTAQTRHISLGQHLYYLVDPTTELTLEEVRQSADFKRNTADIYNGGYRKGTQWLRFSLDTRRQSSDQTWLLELAFPFLWKVDLYLFNGQEQIGHYQSGQAYPHKNRLFEHANTVFPLTFPASDSVQVLLKIDTSGAKVIPVELWDPETFATHSAFEQTLYGIYYGIMLALGLYNIFVYLTVRSKSYLLYAAYIFSLGLMQSSLNGFAGQYLWREWQTFAFLAPTLLSYFTLCLSLLFSRSFLRTADMAPILDKALLVMALFTGCYALAGYWVPADVSLRLLNLVSAVWIALILTSGIVCMIRGQRTARFFLLGWAFLLSAVVIQLANLSGLLPSNLFTNNVLMLGSALEVILLALALADRINQMQKEKQALQQTALQVSEQSNRLKDEFLATISHELRTPMNGVEGSLQLLKDEPLSATAREYLESARHSAHDMMVLIDSILGFSEVQSGKLKLDIRSFNLFEELKTLDQNLKRFARQKGLQSETDIQLASHGDFRGDIQRILLVVRNLLDNAVKFTRQGSVILTVRELSLEQASGRAMLEFRVEDTGIGIPEDKLNAIFDAFRQGDGSFSREFGGLGIGLAISKRLAEAMGGSMTVQSSDGQGSTFALQIPLEVEQADNSGDSADVVPLSLPNTKGGQPVVLVVEDNPVNQMVLKGILKKLGVRVATALNGEEAVARYLEQAPDLILMDCQMPVMDGFEATRKIRALENNQRHTPIVAVTANAMSGDKERCLEAGMDDYMVKPVNRDSVAERVVHWLPGFDLNLSAPTRAC